MANTKKYVSLAKLGLYDEKIKAFLAAADTATLDAAKAYSDGLADNYEAAGNVATAQAALQKNIDAAQAAAEAADSKAAGAQGEVDALETYVGTFTASEGVDTVVKYIDKKTEGIASEGAMTALAGRVTDAEGAIDAIEADYLKAADKTELSDAIAAEVTRAEGIESGLNTRLATVEGDYLKKADKEALQGSIDEVAGDVADIVADYLKAADKTELQGKIDAKVAQADYDAKMEELDGDIDGLQTQINTIMNNPDAEGAINSINEFTQYVADHGTIAEGMRTDINKNKDDIAAEVKRAGDAESALSGRLDILEAIDHDAYVAADTALETKLNTAIGKKADQTALDSAVQALEGADTDIKGRLDAVEGKLGNGEGNVASMIATAKQEAIDAAVAAAATDATTKAGNAESAAKGHADDLNTAMNTRVEALEAIDHDHSNKTVLDGITAAKVTDWDDAVAKEHEHGNKDVIDGITSAKVTAWDTVSSKAAQSDLDGVANRVTAIETWHNDFVECSEAEINALFA